MYTRCNYDELPYLGIRFTKAFRVLLTCCFTIYLLNFFAYSGCLDQLLGYGLFLTTFVGATIIIFLLIAFYASRVDVIDAKKEIFADALRLDSEQFFNRILSKLIKALNFISKIIGLFTLEFIIFKSFFVFSIVRIKLGIIDVNLTNRLIPTPISTPA